MLGPKRGLRLVLGPHLHTQCALAQHTRQQRKPGHGHDGKVKSYVCIRARGCAHVARQSGFGMPTCPSTCRGNNKNPCITVQHLLHGHLLESMSRHTSTSRQTPSSMIVDAYAQRNNSCTAHEGRQRLPTVYQL